MNTDNRVLQTVLRTVGQYDMLHSGDSVIAAVSGGADSVCMLDVLQKLSDEIGFKLCCAHLNHGLRGEAADGDEAFVGQLCKKYKIKFYSKKINVSNLAEEKHLTFEEAGREFTSRRVTHIRKPHHKSPRHIFAVRPQN